MVRSVRKYKRRKSTQNNYVRKKRTRNNRVRKRKKTTYKRKNRTYKRKNRTYKRKIHIGGMEPQPEPSAAVGDDEEDPELVAELAALTEEPDAEGHDKELWGKIKSTVYGLYPNNETIKKYIDDQVNSGKSILEWFNENNWDGQNFTDMFTMLEEMNRT